MSKMNDKFIVIRRILSGILMLLSLSVFGQVNAVFNLSEFNANPATSRTVTLQPMNPYVGNLIFFTSDANGSFTFTNIPPGILFNGVIKAPPGLIQFQTFVTPGQFSGNVDATNFSSLGANSISVYPQGQTAPSWSAAFATFQRLGTGGSNSFYPLFSNPSNYSSLVIVTQIVNSITPTGIVTLVQVTNIATVQANAVGANATNNDALILQSSTNFARVTIGLALTNDVSSSSNAAVLAGGALGTNAAFAIGLNGTNFSYGIGLAATNQSLIVGLL